jgi:hypothetical protein
MVGCFVCCVVEGTLKFFGEVVGNDKMRCKVEDPNTGTMLLVYPTLIQSAFPMTEQMDS